jgi:hypothetical protein
MKKHYLSILAIIIAIGILPTTSVNAQSDIPGGPFDSSISIQNISNEGADVVMYFYDSDGVIQLQSDPIYIEVNNSITIYSSQQNLPHGEYSVVISSSQPVTAMSTLGDSDSIAAYSASDEGYTSWFIPSLYDDYYTYYSEIYAQNTSGAPVNITLDIFRPGNSIPIKTFTETAVPSYASVHFGQIGLDELNKNVPYSGKITAEGNVAVITNIYGSGSTSQQLYSLNGFQNGANVYYTPVICNNYYNWNSAITIQNVDETVANVTVTYNNTYSKDYQVLPNSLALIYIPNETYLPRGLLSAQITSDKLIAVTVNQSNNYNRASTYNGITSASDTVNAPLVMKKYNNFSSSVTCQNLGDSPTAITATFSNGFIKESGSIAPGNNWLIYMPNETEIPDGFDGGVHLVSSNGQPIACIINSNMEFPPYNTMMMDQMHSYNATNQ